MFLLDSNCWMQIIRQREHADEVRQLLENVPPDRLFISIYSVHSIGTILVGRKWIPGYADFLRRASIGLDVQVLTIPVSQLGLVEDVCLKHQLDFDDAYHYVVAELNDLSLVSFDTDFDKTPRGRLTPAAALQKFRDEQRKQQQDA